jgi:hypothetical protein
MAVDDEIEELGSVQYSRWQAYPWKSELHVQRDRVLDHLHEILQGTQAQHDPHDMLGRALGIAALCMRRLIECALVTESFRTTNLRIFEVHRSTADGFREPFRSYTGGNFFANYDLRTRVQAARGPNHVADRLLHARIVAVLSASAFLQDGLLVASDLQFGSSLFHMTGAEFSAIVQAFLDDNVTLATDGVDPGTGKSHWTRS